MLSALNIYYWLATCTTGICSAPVCRGWDLTERPQPWAQRAPGSIGDSITNIFQEGLVIRSAAASEHPPEVLPRSILCQSAGRRGGRGSSALPHHPPQQGSLGAAQTPGVKDQGQSWALCLLLLASGKGKAVLAPAAPGGSRNMFCVSWKEPRHTGLPNALVACASKPWWL